MNHRYQNGHVRCRQRKNGTASWEFMFWEIDPSGKRVRRTRAIGSIEDYPTRELAQAVVNGLRMRINEERHRHVNHTITISHLIDHYIETELCSAASGH